MTAKEKFDLVGEAIALTCPRVVRCFLDEVGDHPFIVVEFVGGAISVRDAEANSQEANIQEAAKLLSGGYYKEVGYYKQLKREARNL